MARRESEQLIELGLAALGGIAGVLANQWLAKLGLKLTTAAIGTTLVATALSALLGGRAGLVAGGAAAGSAGQLAIVWLQTLTLDEISTEAEASGAQG